MAFPFTEDHDMIREAACGFLQEWYEGGKGPERINQSGKAYDEQAWKSFAQELGMAGIAIDEKYGGAGLGDLGRVVVMEELGASLCSIPFLTTCTIVADLISAVGTDKAKLDYLPKIASGEIKAAYCDGHDAKQKRVFNTVYADCADEIFLSRRAGEGVEILGISTKAKGLSITPEKTIDPTRGFSAMDWSGVAENEITVIGTTTPVFYPPRCGVCRRSTKMSRHDARICGTTCPIWEAYRELPSHQASLRRYVYPYRGGAVSCLCGCCCFAGRKNRSGTYCQSLCHGCFLQSRRGCHSIAWRHWFYVGLSAAFLFQTRTRQPHHVW